MRTETLADHNLTATDPTTNMPYPSNTPLTEIPGGLPVTAPGNVKGLFVGVSLGGVVWIEWSGNLAALERKREAFWAQWERHLDKSVRVRKLTPTQIGFVKEALAFQAFIIPTLVTGLDEDPEYDTDSVTVGKTFVEGPCRILRDLAENCHGWIDDVETDLLYVDLDLEEGPKQDFAIKAVQGSLAATRDKLMAGITG